MSDWQADFLERCGELPDAALGKGAFASGAAVWVGNREIAHFDDQNTLDVRVTAGFIRARRPELRADPRIRLRPGGSDWLEIQVQEQADSGYAFALVEAAVLANLNAPTSETNMQRLETIVSRLPEAVRVDIEAWGGEPTFRVNGKNFIFTDPEATSVSLKLPLQEAAAVVADDPLVDSTGYGLGRHGWVSVKISPRTSRGRWREIEEWVRTSYTLVAPKRLARLVLTEDSTRSLEEGSAAESATEPD